MAHTSTSSTYRNSNYIYNKHLMLKKLFFALIVAAVALSANAEKKPAKVQIHLRNGQVGTGVITERDERVVTIANDADQATSTSPVNASTLARMRTAPIGTSASKPSEV